MNKRTRSLIECGIFAALISVLSLITIPLPSSVPLTLQTFAVSLCGYFLGVKKALASLLTYLAIGLVGIPVFSSFQGGFSVLLGPTGGFLMGFIFLVCFTGIGSKKKNIKGFLIGLIGLGLCHLTGVIFFSFNLKEGFINSFLISSAPFILKDILSIYLANLASKILKKRILQ